MNRRRVRKTIRKSKRTTRRSRRSARRSRRSARRSRRSARRSRRSARRSKKPAKINLGFDLKKFVGNLCEDDNLEQCALNIACKTGKMDKVDSIVRNLGLKIDSESCKRRYDNWNENR